MGKNTRRGFTHIGSLVYTPRPSKDGPASKVVTPTSLKSSRPLKRFDEADDPPHWVEQLDLLRRLDGCHDNEDEDDADADHGVLPNAVQNNVGEADLLGLQSEIVESKEELWKMDSVEQGICYSAVQGLEMVAEVQENAEGVKDEELPYVHKELQEKQNEPVEIKPLLQDAEDADLRTDENGMHSEEAKEIQPEITSLKFQLKVAIHEFIRATCLSVACSLEQGVDDHRPTMLNHEEKLEVHTEFQVNLSSILPALLGPRNERVL